MGGGDVDACLGALDGWLLVCHCDVACVLLEVLD